MLLLSTQTLLPAKKFGLEKAIDLICDAGFEAIDLSMFDILKPQSEFFGDGYLEFAKQLKQKANSRGVIFNQAHAPFPSYKVGDNDYNEAILPALKKSIEIAATVGAEQIVVHPTYLEEGKKEFNMNFYKSLEPLCREYGIKIALENMFSRDKENPKQIIPNVCSIAEEFKDYVTSLNPEYFTACLDIGHCGLVGEDVSHTIETLGEHLTALHIHDNDGIRDLHTLPFTQSIDFSAVAKSLKKIGYKGDLTLEADEFIGRMPTELFPDALKLMCSAAKKLKSMIEEA